MAAANKPEVLAAHKVEDCPFTDLGYDERWDASASFCHSTLRCKVCGVLFEEWVVQRIKALDAHIAAVRRDAIGEP